MSPKIKAKKAPKSSAKKAPRSPAKKAPRSPRATKSKAANPPEYTKTSMKDMKGRVIYSRGGSRSKLFVRRKDKSGRIVFRMITPKQTGGDGGDPDSWEYANTLAKKQRNLLAGPPYDSETEQYTPSIEPRAVPDEDAPYVEDPEPYDDDDDDRLNPKPYNEEFGVGNQPTGNFMGLGRDNSFGVGFEVPNVDDNNGLKYEGELKQCFKDGNHSFFMDSLRNMFISESLAYINKYININKKNSIKKFVISESSLIQSLLTEIANFKKSKTPETYLYPETSFNSAGKNQNMTYMTVFDERNKEANKHPKFSILDKDFHVAYLNWICSKNINTFIGLCEEIEKILNIVFVHHYGYTYTLQSFCRFVIHGTSIIRMPSKIVLRNFNGSRKNKMSFFDHMMSIHSLFPGVSLDYIMFNNTRAQHWAETGPFMQFDFHFFYKTAPENLDICEGLKDKVTKPPFAWFFKYEGHDDNYKLARKAYKLITGKQDADFDRQMQADYKLHGRLGCKGRTHPYNCKQKDLDAESAA